MKLIALALATVAKAQADSTYTADLTHQDVLTDSTNTKCFKCDVTGSSTVNTYAACKTQGNGNLEVCAEGDIDVCYQDVTMNAAGEVVGLRTGCKQARACRNAQRQNFVGGIALRNQCKPDPSLFRMGRFGHTSRCSVCFAKCETEEIDCFEPSKAGGNFIKGFYDGTAYIGATGDHADYTSDTSNPSQTNLAPFWQPGAFLNTINGNTP